MAFSGRSCSIARRGGKHGARPCWYRGEGATAEAGTGEALAAGRRGVGAGRRQGMRATRAGEAFHALANMLRRELDIEWHRGTLFVLSPVFVGIGVLVYVALPLEPDLAQLGAATVVAGVLAFALRRWTLAHLALLASCAVLAGATLATLQTWRDDTLMAGSAVTTRLTASVVRIEHQASGRTRYVLDVLATERPRLSYAPERVRLTAREHAAGIEAGSIVTGLARLMPWPGPVMPGSYDFGYHSYYDGIGAIGFFMLGPAPSGEISQYGPLAQARIAIEKLRNAIAARVRAHLDGAEAEIAAALIAGVRAGIPDEAAEALRKTGLAHVLSISGLHMALVAGTVLVSMRTLLALSTRLSSRRPVKKYASAIALAACAFYLALSGAEVAAQRSFIMLAVMLVAVMCDRAALTMRNLAISALIVIAVAPHEVVGPSFQMSFAATVALIGAYGWWSDRRLARVDERGHVPPRRGAAGNAAMLTAKFFLGLAATSLIAGLATALFGAYHFNRVSPHSLWVNLLAMPLVSIIVMPSAVLATVLMPFHLEGPFLRLMGVGIEGVLAIAQWFAERTPIDGVGAVPVPALLVLAAALIAATMLTSRLRLLCVPLAIVGAAMLAARPGPPVFVTEDARLVGLRTADGRLAVNRTRPNAFTIENWLHALGAGEVAKPHDAPSLEAAFDAARRVDGFHCSEERCIAVTTDGDVVAHVAEMRSAMELCGKVAVIVIEDATAGQPCRIAEPLVLTGRDLARHGAAAIRFAGEGATQAAQARFAIDEPYRPWHEHRQYSRAARGLPEYR